MTPSSPKKPSLSTLPLASSLPPLTNRLQASPETVVLLLALLIGSGTGIAVVSFHYLIGQIHSLMLEDFMGAVSGWGTWTLALVPVLGGLVVGLLRWQWQDFGPTLSSLISSPQSAANASAAKGIIKAIAASVSLGTGASLGPEGPSVEIGSNVGVFLGKVLQVSQERQRLLLGAGAAAGLAAGFNAPIAGVFFALEVVLGTTFATSAVSVVLLSAVVAALISQIGLGGQPAFTLPSYEVRSPLELPLYLGLGLLASLVSIAYTQAIQLCQRFFQGKINGFGSMEQIPVGLRPVIGGVCIGAVSLIFPQVLGIGYETIEAMLRDVQFSLPLLMSLLIAKLVMTALSLGSGFVGGLFAPAMFLGASLGAAYGKTLALFPLIISANIAAPPAYAMVGMAAVLAASVRAPLTAILLLFELTRDYRIILPLMAAVGLSVWLVEWLKPITSRLPTIQPAELEKESDQRLEIMQHLQVGQAMHQDYFLLSSGLSILDGGLALVQHQTHCALIVDEQEQLVGIVTLQDINRAIAQWEPGNTENHQQEFFSLRVETLWTICTKEILCAYEDEPIADAQSRMATRGLRQLPVVNRDAPRQIVGLLEQDKIRLAYSLAITQNTLNPHLTKAVSPADAQIAAPSEAIPLTALKQSA
ncbi:chloride channel protein [Phormidium sp. CLA17]|uniref:chloride channel protein n=1 Tax=Leptolyngbya sp. Cla-17 TaxID=2803751 RepID=UPI001491A8E7|nr:chloride channel protein [Leptolyngbya sp. Cla-17]MBM0741230.1 chloride channel protein [Leptolyngbya sp. Cla-17]